MGEKGGIKHTVCKPISEAESRKSEHRQNSLSVSGELAGTTQVNIWKTKLLSAQHRKQAARSTRKMSVRPNLSTCVYAEESQKISTNVTIYSGLTYRPQRPRTWLLDLFLQTVTSPTHIKSFLYVLAQYLLPVMLVEGTSDSHQPNRVYFAICLCLVFILIIKASNADWDGNSFLRKKAVCHANYLAAAESVSKITSKKAHYSFFHKYWHC